MHRQACHHRLNPGIRGLTVTQNIRNAIAPGSMSHSADLETKLGVNTRKKDFQPQNTPDHEHVCNHTRGTKPPRKLSQKKGLLRHAA